MPVNLSALNKISHDALFAPLNEYFLSKEYFTSESAFSS